ncbi:MAG: ROK family protein [Fimbriimonadales bacterium]|nr:ROK family protein [Fimbriimonadales bacterium]
MSNDAQRKLADLAKPAVVPPLDPEFRPAVLANAAFAKLARSTGRAQPLRIGLERSDGTRSVFDAVLLPEDHPDASLNLPVVERLVKFLLWQKGGWKVTIGGPKSVADHVAAVYSPGGERAFDWEFMGETVYERPFTVAHCQPEEVPAAHETSMPVGRHLEGCRVGFDLGASDRKAAAVIDGETVYSEEVVWDPRGHSDPQYHYDEILAGIRSAAERLPRLDAVGGSSAGVIVNNRPMVASLFRGVPREQYHRVRSIFQDIGRELGVPIEVANDGDVTALAGAMSMNAHSVLGVAMGSSEAVGYVNQEGNITGWLNELAFAPIDFRPDAPADEWSGDRGCGVQYLTQQAVFRLAEAVGIRLPQDAPLAERLKTVQRHLEADDERAVRIWQTIGVYLGYAIAHYACFYPVRHLLVLGRVTSGKGGPILIAQAEEVLRTEFPDLASRLKVQLPDETTRRVGQAVAAASLPSLRKEPNP